MVANIDNLKKEIISQNTHKWLLCELGDDG